MALVKELRIVLEICRKDRGIAAARGSFETGMY